MRRREAFDYTVGWEFPFLFGGTFIEAAPENVYIVETKEFPFLFGGTFIEAWRWCDSPKRIAAFPFLFGGTFIEATTAPNRRAAAALISLPFRRDFH